MRSIRRLGLVAFAVLIALGAALPAAAGSGTTRVRAFHDSPDTPAVDILLNGAATPLTHVTFGTISGYLDLPVGAEVTVRIVEGPAKGAELKITVPASSRPLTVAAIGLLSKLGDPAQGLRLEAFSDRSGFSRYFSLLRVAHTSPDAPSVDVQVALFGRWVPVIHDLSFGQTSSYLPLPSRLWNGHLITYSFRVVVHGTNTVVASVKTPLPYRALTVWATGTVIPGDSAHPFALKITEDGGQ